MARDLVVGLFPRPVALTWLALVAVQVFVVAGLVLDTDEVRPRDAPYNVVAPGVVADGLADLTRDLEPGSLVAVPGTDAERARRDVREGTTVAALVVDLTGTEDRLLVHPDQDEQLRTAVVERIRAVGDSLGRTIRVDRVTEERGWDRQEATVFALATAVLGFAAVVLVSLVRGPVAVTFRRALLRHSVLVVLAPVAAGALVLTGVVPAPAPADTGTWSLVGVGALGVLAASLTTLALEALLGWAGLGVAGIVFLVLSTPVLTRPHPYLLPEPWQSLARTTPGGATVDALEAVVVFGGHGVLAPVAFLLAWIAMMVVAGLLARFVRHRLAITADEVTPRTPARRRTRWRARVVVVVVPATALLLATMTALPLRPVATAEPPAPRASETTCVETTDERIDGVDDLNRFVAGVGGLPEHQGGDVGASVRLQGGRRLFVFGDTLTAERGSPGFVRNSMLLTTPTCVRAVTAPDAGAAIPDRADGVGYWPMGVVRSGLPGYDLLTVTAQRVRTTGQGPFDFETLGPALAVFVVPVGGTPQLLDVQDLGPDDADPTRPTWGAAVATSGPGEGRWVYLYGTARPLDATMVFGYSLHVARARPQEVLDRDRWQYWDGRGWSPAADASAALIPATGGVSQTLSVFEQGGDWYALSKRDEFLGRDLTVWKAEEPTGPFDQGHVVASLPSDAVGGELTYMPLAHPDLFPRPETVVVGYSRNRTDLGEVVDDPTRYRLHFLRVDLP